MSEEIKEETPTGNSEVLKTVEDGFSLDNLQKHFQECLQEDKTISLDKYISGTQYVIL